METKFLLVFKMLTPTKQWLVDSITCESKDELIKLIQDVIDHKQTFEILYVIKL